jgi:transcriptional regulator with XRE-family HTH domain
MVMDVEQSAFSQRLSQLRLNKGVSARDMSLSIGQSASYINNVENGVCFPSMAAFFYICDYLGVTPAEFFEVDSQSPVKEKELLDAVKGLSTEHLDHLIALAKALKK